MLLLARGAARLSSHAYDLALADAKAALAFPHGDKPFNLQHESALLLAAKAEYGLRRFRESYRWVQKLITVYPRNDEGLDMAKQCIRRIVEQEKGIYNWEAMLKEARPGNLDSDHANYVGPIEVRVCEDSTCGRGLFVTKDVEPGELLLVEKAFSAAFAKQGECKDGPEKLDKAAGGGATPQSEANKKKARDQRKAFNFRLEAKIFTKVHSNSSLQPAFLDLYPGLTITKEGEMPESLCEAVRTRLRHNGLWFQPLYIPSASYTSLLPTKPLSRGIWINSSYMNHTCNPNVRRSFIGDLMIVRAQTQIPRDTEIRVDYVSCLWPASQRRQILLSRYGFDCDCERCVSEATTPPRSVEARREFCNALERMRMTQDDATYDDYDVMLSAIEGTYMTAPTVEPRIALIRPLLSLIADANAAGDPLRIIDLIAGLVVSLGFVPETPANREQEFEFSRWGFLIDEMVLVLKDLARALRLVERVERAKGAEKEARKCHLILCGADTSWEMEPAV